jgi:hypothetical protein
VTAGDGVSSQTALNAGQKDRRWLSLNPKSVISATNKLQQIVAEFESPYVYFEGWTGRFL